MKSLRPVIGAVVVLAGLAGAFAWYRTGHAAADPDALVLQGNVDIRQVALAFDGAGRIVDLAVREGDTVRAGDVLGHLDARVPQARLDQARAQVQVSTQVLARLVHGNRPEEIAQARAARAAARADADLAEQQWQRLQQVRADTAGQGAAAQDLDAARARRDAAQARLQGAEAAATLAEAGARPEDIAQARAQLAAARAQQVLAERDLADTTLRAPGDAVVRSRLQEPGDMASPQRPVYTLAVTQPKWVRAYVPEPLLARLRTGLAGEVRVDGLPRRAWPARLAYIASVAEFTPKSVETTELRPSLVYEVRWEVQDPKDELRLGMPATVRARLPAATDAR